MQGSGEAVLVTPDGEVYVNVELSIDTKAGVALMVMSAHEAITRYDGERVTGSYSVAAIDAVWVDETSYYPLTVVTVEIDETKSDMYRLPSMVPELHGSPDPQGEFRGVLYESGNVAAITLMTESEPVFTIPRTITID